ncbi:hypothetical protein BGZ60DRAFT_410668 [Tricladium varicosporioides]|nr:hypothetical protein BGZ60DRAFT_410668 [Hymenoscyphus varicosporioides]
MPCILVSSSDLSFLISCWISFWRLFFLVGLVQCVGVSILGLYLSFDVSLGWVETEVLTVLSLVGVHWFVCGV